MSSHSPTSYIEGVPVKISEKYKPPPKISLPQKIVQCLAQCSTQVDEDIRSASPFNFQLERHTQIYLSSWKNQLQQDRFARKERFRQRQIDRQKQHDEHQKRLLTAVSYPSAEDLSSEDEENKVTETVVDDDKTVPQLSEGNTKDNTSPVQDIHPRYDTILLPTIMPGPPKPNSSWSFATNLYESATTSNTVHSDNGSIYSTSVPNQSMTTINWSDFETDTSNPFDNVELKSINDLDILAQVLKQNNISASSEHHKEIAKDLKNEMQSENTVECNQSTTQFPNQNANILNSNGDQPSSAIANQSYQSPDPSCIYASNISYQNQQHPHHQQILPQQPSTIQHHQVYFNYQIHQTMPPDNNYPTNCNQAYAANYGVYGVPHNSSLADGHVQQESPVNRSGALPIATVVPTQANSVPDILRQLNSNPSAGQAQN